MGEQLTKIGTIGAIGGLALLAIGLLIFLIYKVIDSIKYGDYLCAFLFFLMSIFTVSVSLVVIGLFLT